MKDLYEEIISATKMILRSEGLSDVKVRIKEGVVKTYYTSKENCIQFGEVSIKAKLNPAKYYPLQFRYYVCKYGKCYVFGKRQYLWLTATERIACVILEEVAHVKAYSEGYHQLHGGYFIGVYKRLFEKYFDKVKGMLKSVKKYEVFSLKEAVARTERMKWEENLIGSVV